MERLRGAENSVMNPETLLVEAWLKAGIQSSGEVGCAGDALLLALVNRDLPEQAGAHERGCPHGPVRSHRPARTALCGSGPQRISPQTRNTPPRSARRRIRARLRRSARPPAAPGRTAGRGAYWHGALGPP